MSEVTVQCTVHNPKGIHCRVATRMAEIVAPFDARVQLAVSEETADCSAILDVLSLGLARNSQVYLTARGPDAEKVVAALAVLLSQTEDP